MKTRLGTRTGSKNPRKRVQNAPEHESAFGVQKLHSALLECRIGSFWALAQRLSSDDKAHPFRSFRKRMSPDSRSTHRSYFLEFMASINRDWIS